MPGGLSSFDVTASLQAWLADPESNQGWALLPISGSGWDFHSAQGATPPRLIVNYVPEPGTPVTKQIAFRAVSLTLSMIESIARVVFVRLIAPASDRDIASTSWLR